MKSLTKRWLALLLLPFLAFAACTDSSESENVASTQQALTCGLVAAYSFDQTSGSVLNDISGNGNNGSITAATWSTTAKSGHSLSFNGTTAVVTIPSSSSLNSLSQMTVESWVRPTTLGTKWRTVIMKESAPADLTFGLYANQNIHESSPVPAFWLRTGVDQAIPLSGGSTLPTNTWSHLAASYDGSTVKFYLNGSLVVSRSQTGSIATSSGNLKIGASTMWPDTEAFTGQIDTTCVWGTARTITEIQGDMLTTDCGVSTCGGGSGGSGGSSGSAGTGGTSGGVSGTGGASGSGGSTSGTGGTGTSGSGGSGGSQTSAIYRVDSGGNAIPPFSADQNFSGGNPFSTTNTISTSGVTNAAPAAVYQSERFGNFTYTFGSLTPSTSYTVRLHFAEIFFTSSGSRLFNVTINGNQVLTNFDIYATVGANTALVRDFNTTANGSGQIAVQFTSVVDNAKVSGIEILGADSGSGGSGGTGGSSAGTGGTAGSSGSSDTGGAAGTGGSTAGSSGTGGSAGSGSGLTYSTNFDLIESPVSESGAWTHTGLDWTLVNTSGGWAFGTQTGSGGFNDSYAYLSGFPADQMASAVIHLDPAIDRSTTHEVELLLRWADAAHNARGYECNLAFDGSYAQIVRWNGPFGNFTYLDLGTAPSGVHDGDVMSATAIGNTITLKLNGVTLAQHTDTEAPWPTGNPGMGFWRGGPSGAFNGDFTFTSYTASSVP